MVRTKLSSIQFKLFVVIFALAAVLVGLLDTFFLSQQVEYVRGRLENRAVAYARLLSHQVTAEGGGQGAPVHELFNAMLTDPDVRGLSTFDAGGRLLQSAGQIDPTNAGVTAALSGVRLLSGDGGIRAVAPVARPGGPVATIAVDISLDRERRERAVIRRMALGIGASALALGAAAAWLVGRSMARRLRTLADAARAAARGDLSPRRLDDSSGDEIGQLATSFNAMFRNITALIGQIRETGRLENEHLDWLVHEHTKELNSAMERYRTLVEKTNAVPWELEPRTLRVAYISPQVEKLLGRPVSDYIKQGALGFVHPEDRERVAQAFTRLSGSTEARNIDLEYRVLGAGGQTLHVRSAVSTDASSPDAPAPLRGITVDVTQQRTMEMELRQAQKLESVGRLAAGVAHEINTPVQFVSDSVHFVRDASTDVAALIERYRGLRGELEAVPTLAVRAGELAAFEEEIELDYLLANIPQALDRSLEGLGRVATIVRSMKEFAHPEERDMGPLDLNHAIESTLTIARNEYKYVADVQTEFGQLPAVVCHGGDVNQALLNIIVNAAHAIGEKVEGTELRGTITIKTWRDGDRAVVAIRDTGGGIPATIRDRIFDPFFTTKEVGKGTGQGLAIARAVVVDKHRGELSLESEDGVGTTFFIRLPIDGATGTRSEAAA